MIKTTKSGFTFEIAEDAHDDMELVDALADMYAGNPFAVSKVVRLLLGEDQRKRLYDHLKERDGRTKASAVMAEIEEIFCHLTQKEKNS